MKLPPYLEIWGQVEDVLVGFKDEKVIREKLGI